MGRRTRTIVEIREERNVRSVIGAVKILRERQIQLIINMDKRVPRRPSTPGSGCGH